MSKYLLKTKLEAVDLYQRGFSTKEIQEKLHITSRRSIDGWINNYQQYGNRGLEKSFSKTRYSGQFKLEVLNWRKEHSASYQITANHFNIKQHSTIANWQRKLNEGGVDALFIKQGRPLMHKKKIKAKKHHASYGYWPVTDTLRMTYHLMVNHKRVQRLMRENNLGANKYNLRAGKYDSSKGPQNKKAKNRFHQKFKTDRPYQKVVTDISEFRYGNMTIRDRVYLSPFKDLFSGEIISYTITDRPLTRYVLEGLEGVFTARPKLLNYRMTIHSDQGIQYQSNPYRHALRKHKVFQSMSRRATCHDNAAMESFFHIMKVEMNYFTHHFDTKKQLVKAMKEWISYYNEDRIRHKLKGLTPIQYRNQALSKMI